LRGEGESKKWWQEEFRFAPLNPLPHKNYKIKIKKLKIIDRVTKSFIWGGIGRIIRNGIVWYYFS